MSFNSPPALPEDHRGSRLLVAVKDNLFLLFGAVVLAWGVEIVDTLLLGRLDQFGIRPRTREGLIGVVTAPFLHLGFGHLLSNTVPFLLLGGVVLLGGRKLFVVVTLVVAALGGMALWTLGPPASNHIGASLLVFGYLGFLLARGVFERSVFWIVVSVTTLLLYGGMIRGVFPSQPGISWQGHLCGFLAGVVAARLLISPKARAERVA